ncbi:NADH:ubiquinone oxidoreductase, membrane subunit J [Desulfosarcina cetonica]|uniref:NADH-quinone oxidoreductase subunit J family protein n=1 Tax=Desulfosarcina cetonica TaxID=90730 RepID=UPI0006D0BBDF|nr:NADH-quinone oxidoreductase subunit J [Desulfosarcina cetonica]VTR68383.1 NADH:ubiquinone oxidoreductase, membrane subunit J [Desulfosarcina cetonica]
MSILTILFYAIALLILAATAMAVTRRNMVHAVLYLVLSFFGTAMLFYLLGAPFLAALEIIIYAGAIMVLFLFMIMMLRLKKPPGMFFPAAQLLPAVLISAGFLVVSTALMGRTSAGWDAMAAAQADPTAFGIYLFQNHWLAVEIASMLLLVALVGAYLLGLRARRTTADPEEAS